MYIKLQKMQTNLQLQKAMGDSLGRGYMVGLSKGPRKTSGSEIHLFSCCGDIHISKLTKLCTFKSVQLIYCMSIIPQLNCFIYFLVMQLVGSQFPDQGERLGPRQQTTRVPGNSLKLFEKKKLCKAVLKERKRERGRKGGRKKERREGKEAGQEEGRKKLRDVNLAENVGQEGKAVSIRLLLCNK